MARNVCIGHDPEAFRRSLQNASWRATAEGIWPFTHGPACTSKGQAEVAWLARRQPIAA